MRKLESVKVFAHLHYDTFNRGLYNGTEDPHIFSPAFDDEILGNDSAVPFMITVAEDDAQLPIPFFTILSVLVTTPILIRALRNYNKNQLVN